MLTETASLKQVEGFLYREAALLNGGKFNEWLSLFSADSIYWIPCNMDDYDPMTHVSIVYDDFDRLNERVARLQSGIAYGQEPQSKTRHLITNVEVLEQTGSKIIVTSNFLIVEQRRGRQNIYAGRFEHHLISQGPSFKIQFKKVELINNDEPLGNLSFLL